MSKPKPPTPPDPRDTSAQQTGTNVGTSIANTMMGMVGQNTPYGTLSYEQTGRHDWTDPFTNQTYAVPTFTANTENSPAMDRLMETNMSTQQQMGDMALNQSRFLSNYLGQGFNPFGTPQSGVQPNGPGNTWNPKRPQPNGPANTMRNRPGGVVQPNGPGNTWNRPSTVPGRTAPQAPAISDRLNMSEVGATAPRINMDGVGDVTKTYGGDFSEDRRRIEDEMFGRIRGEATRDREGIRAQLAQQGIAPGSEAYNRQMLEHDRRTNDSRYGAMMYGGQEQSRMTAMDAARAQFQNQAQNQAYGQAANNAQFQNASQAQRYGQAMDTARFGNSARQQGFGNDMALANLDDSRRQQYLQERFAIRNQPINEITALLSGAQVNSPQFNIAQPTRIPNVDNAGLINDNYNQRYQQYQMQNAQRQSLLGGLFGLGGSMLMGF